MQYPRYTKIEHKAAVLDLLLSSRHPSPSTHCVFVALIKNHLCYPSAISTLSISSYSLKSETVKVIVLLLDSKLIQGPLISIIWDGGE